MFYMSLMCMMRMDSNLKFTEPSETVFTFRGKEIFHEDFRLALQKCKMFSQQSLGCPAVRSRCHLPINWTEPELARQHSEPHLTLKWTPKRITGPRGDVIHSLAIFTAHSTGVKMKTAHNARISEQLKIILVILNASYDFWCLCSALSAVTKSNTILVWSSVVYKHPPPNLSIMHKTGAYIYIFT